MTGVEIAFNAATAAGTLLAVLAALYVAGRDRRAADARAEQDREALAKRQQEERDYERRLADARWRLDFLVQLQQAPEAFVALANANMPPYEARGLLEALIRAYPAPLPLLRMTYLGERPSQMADALDAMKRYGMAGGRADSTEGARAELAYLINEARKELLRPL